MRSALAMFVLCWCAPAAPAQTILARLEFEAPSGPRAVLRAVLPLPADRDPALPLCLRLPGIPSPVPAQLEAVARGADGKVEIVEVAAAVTAPPGWTAGSPLVASVLDATADSPLPARSPRLDSRIAELLDKSRPGQIYLRAKDLHGNEYRADLSGTRGSDGLQSAQLQTNGPWLLRRRIASVFVPVGEAQDGHKPLPHLMGVHAYMTERADLPALTLDLRVHNGLASPTASPSELDAPLGPVWFRSIELVAPGAFVVEPDVRDAAMGPARSEGGRFVLPLVAATSDGRLQCMPAQAQFQRRLVVRTADAPWAARDLSGFRDLGFALAGQGLWSFESLPRWFPQHERLPSPLIHATAEESGAQVVRRRDAEDLERILTVLKGGTAQSWPYLADAMGWCHPWLEPQQGTTGGFGILLSEGHWSVVAASRAGVQKLALQHRMTAARQPQAAYDRHGRALGVDLWQDAEGRIPFDYRMNGDIRPAMFAGKDRLLPAAVEQAQAVEAAGLRPAWDRGDPYAKRGTLKQESGNIHAWWPIDDQHLVRWTAAMKALVWAANDPLARDDLLATAALARLALHDRAHGGSRWGAGATLGALEAQVAAFPAAGLPWGRGEAWMIDAMAAAHAVANDAWRAANRPWFQRVRALLDSAAMQTGLVMRVNNARHKEHERYDTAQAFECILLLHAQRVLADGVFGDADQEARDQLRRRHIAACDYLYDGPLWQEAPDERGRPQKGPRQIFAIAYKDRPQTPPFGVEPHWRRGWLPDGACEGGVEVYWSWSALAHAWRLSGPSLDSHWSAKLLQLGPGSADHAALRAETARNARNKSTDNTANMLELLRIWEDAGIGVR